MSSSLSRTFTVGPRVAAALVVGAILLAWCNSLRGPFVFDDLPSIVENPTIRTLWPPAWLTPPATAGETVSGRPVLNLSFALNHAIGGLHVGGYHLVNLLIHSLAALTLLGILRRTLARRAVDNANGITLVITLLWAVHPLQTAAVTYVVQRAESLAGLFFLLTFYAFIRAATALPEVSANARRWQIVAIITCLLGIGTKETVAMAPLVLLLYDRTFLAGSFRAAWQQRGRLHLALFAAWIPLAVLVLTNHGRGGSAGWGGTITPVSYLLTQVGAITHYLALTLAPVGQIFDYGRPIVTSLSAILPQLLLLVALAVTSARACWRGQAAGFLGIVFFLLLAPSSSVIPVSTQTIAEHRMYLPIAAVITLVVLAAARGLHRLPHPGRWTTATTTVAVLALGISTFARNQVYRSEITLWQDTVDQRPDNPRAFHNLGSALRRADRPDEAAAAFRRALVLQPNHAFAHFELGTLLLQRRNWTAAATHLEAAVAADPHYIAARINLGQALTALQRPAEAVAQYRTVLAYDSTAVDAQTNLAALLLEQDQLAEAESLLRVALATDPTLAPAHYHLGRLLEQTDRLAAAEASFRTAIRLDPRFAAAPLALGNLLASRGDYAAAETAVRTALALDPDFVSAHYALGNTHAARRQFGPAIAAYRAALALDGSHIEARNNLANCQLVTGQLAEAIANYQAVLQVRPDDTAVRENLALARQLQQTRPQGQR